MISKELVLCEIKNWLKNLLMVSRLTLASHDGNAQKDKNFLSFFRQEIEIKKALI